MRDQDEKNIRTLQTEKNPADQFREREHVPWTSDDCIHGHSHTEDDARSAQENIFANDSMFMNLQKHHAVVYDEVLITAEPVKKMNEANKAFKVQCPVSISCQAD